MALRFDQASSGVNVDLEAFLVPADLLNRLSLITFLPMLSALRPSLLCAVACLLAAAPLRSQDAAPASSPPPAPSPAPLYRLTATWHPPGDGGWDYLTADSFGRRLYVARQDRIQVLDTDTGNLVGEIKGLDGAHGVALAPRLGRGFATSGRASTVVAFDLKTLAPIGDPIPVGTKPDAICFVPGRDRVFAFNGGSANATVIDAHENKVLQTIALDGKPEFAVAEGAGRVFVNLEDKDEVAEIDTDPDTTTEAFKVNNRYPLKQGHTPTGLSLDPDGGRLFVGCENEKMVVMATEDGTIMATLPIGKGVDATGFDNRTKTAFASNGEDGTLTVLDAYKVNPKVVATISTQRSARTLAVDQKTHSVYLAAADFILASTPGERPQMAPGSFVILKYDYTGTRVKPAP